VLLNTTEQQTLKRSNNWSKFVLQQSFSGAMLKNVPTSKLCCKNCHQAHKANQDRLNVV
jgi:hypothetical protein